MNPLIAAPVVIVRPGKLFACRTPVWIRTVLGSCVSLCLCDRAGQVGGMNHFMLPGEGYVQDPTCPARYGVHAIELLINAMFQLGADRSRFEAMAFGGADVLAVTQGSLSVAQANVAFVREFLKIERIPLVKGLLGGSQPMRVSFLSTTGAVTVERVGRGAVQRIVTTESRLFSAVGEQSRKIPARQVTIF
jgi:chemotaxis receptor (MCP) glutamine deamidase CheD